MVDYYGHQIDFDQVNVNDRKIRNKQVKVVEAIHTRKRKLTLNRQGGFDLQWIYMHLQWGGGGMHLQTTKHF